MIPDVMRRLSEARDPWCHHNAPSREETGMKRNHSLYILCSAAAIYFGTGAAGAQVALSASSSVKSVTPSATRQYGPAVTVGEGRARSYVLLDAQSGKPRELGVALDERALDGLPSAGSGHHGAGPMT